MARLPDADDLGGLPSFDSGRPISGVDLSAIAEGSRTLGRGIQSLGADLAEIGEAERQAQARRDRDGLVRAKSDYLTKKIELDGAYERDTRYGDALTGEYGGKLKTIGDEAGKGLTSPRAREYFGLWRQQQDAEGNARMRDRSWVNEKDAYVADVNARREALRQSALKSTNERERAAAIETANEMLDGAVERGFVSKTDAQTARQAWVQSYAKEAAANLPAGERIRVLGGGDKSAALLRELEDFRGEAYHDVNAPRVGYGSDTITRPDGSVVRVTKDTKITRDDAERDLARRIRQTQGSIIEAVGADSWKALNDDQQAALTSVGYNYGTLPKSVVAAVKTGDTELIARSVETLKPHNDGINSGRRQKEADIIRGKRLARTVPGEGSVYSFIDETDRVSMLRQAENEVAADARAQEQAARELRQEVRGRYDLAIEQDQVGRDDILNEPNLDDSDKAVLVRRWDERNEDSRSAASVWQSVQAGEPLDPDQAKKGLNKLFEQAGGMPALADSEPKAVAAVDYLWKKAQVIPSNAKTTLTGMIRSTDQGKTISGLTILDSLQRQNPATFRATFDENVEKAVTYYQDRVGYSGEKEIFEGIKTLFDPQTFKAREPLVKAGMDKAVKEYDADTVAGLFDQSYLPFTAPGAPERVQDAALLQQDFHRLYAEAYAEDPANAEKNALQLLQRKWGVSKINNGGIMRYPPETYYPKVNGSHDWMTEQLEADLRNLGYTVEQSAWVTAPAARNRGRVGWTEKPEPLRNYVLQALPLTESDIASGQPPHYAVLVANPTTGEWEAVLDKSGAAVAYQWDVTGPREKARKDFRERDTNRKNLPPEADIPLPALGN